MQTLFFQCISLILIAVCALVKAEAMDNICHSDAPPLVLHLNQKVKTKYKKLLDAYKLNSFKKYIVIHGSLKENVHGLTHLVVMDIEEKIHYAQKQCIVAIILSFLTGVVAAKLFSLL